MNYWHIQMNKGLIGNKQLPLNEIRDVVVKQNIIGTGEWKDASSDQCKAFKESIDIGDIVMVREGKIPIALVRVTGANIPRQFYENQRNVKVLSLFDHKIENIIGKYFGKTQGTLTIVDNRNNATGKFIISWHKLIEETNNLMNILQIIKNKGQIILQGPPGTGKTRMAKELSKKLVKESYSIDESTIRSFITLGLIIPSSTEYTEYTICKIGHTNVTVELKGLTSQYSPSYNEIINAFNIRKWEGKQQKGNDPYAAAIAKFVYDHLPDNNISLIQFHPSFTYEDFVRGISVEINNGQPEYIVKNRILVEMAEKALANPLLNFVLIIDEINRANLPAVLGELIYALEYRFDPDKPKETTVESLYGIKKEDSIEPTRELRLPKNLFIIGTMNTADRSVGHIDYAIRRRFAFVDVLPDPEPVHPDVKSLFSAISGLFIKDLGEYIQTGKLERSDSLASDFRPDDVWIGHSYFICKDKDEKDLPSLEAKPILFNKIRYEVVPILKEYIKDGILLDNDKTKNVIQTLSAWS